MAKSSRKVVIGLTGRPDSVVAAYILKKQGHDCVGVSLLFGDENRHVLAKKELEKDLEKNPDKDFQMQAGVSPEDFLRRPLSARCEVDDPLKIKKFCDWLDIPFYAVKAQDDFKERVLEQSVAARLQGRSHNPCLNCQKLKVEILLEKAKLLKADFVATGHYAKIYKNHHSGQYSMLSSNDLECDQSALISSLEQKDLERLILPLAEMRRKEVLKLAGMIDCELMESQRDDKPCLVEDPRFPFYVESMSADSLYKEGVLYDVESDITLGEHYGLHYFRNGQSKLKVQHENSLDPDLSIIKIDPATGRISVCRRSKIYYHYSFVGQLKMEEKLDFSRPLEVFVRRGTRGDLWAGRLFFKNNNLALIQFDEACREIMTSGEVLTFYNRTGIAAKLLGRGVIEAVGDFHKGGEVVPYFVAGENEHGDKIRDVRRLLNLDFEY